MKWFEVSKEGLAKLLEKRGKQFIVHELIQNAWDENTTRVDVWLTRQPGSIWADIEVTDDNPEGFKDLSHAFTLFAESAKKSDAEKRGRFNLGEKLVLALCSHAAIETTTGRIVFDKDGRHRLRTKTSQGSKFTGTVRMTQAEMDECKKAVLMLIPPANIVTHFNGAVLEPRERVAHFSEVLPTEFSDEEGILRKTTRKTLVEIYEPRDDEPAMLYEMGIPVVTTGDRWHVNIMQKVPLNMDRDNVTPAFLGQVRHVVAECMARDLSTEDANSTWVRDAMQRHGDEMSDGLIRNIVTQRFGEKRVAYDPSDPEANALAVTKGFTVVHGSQMSKEEWSAVKRTGAILPAGQVTPSPKPFSADGRPLRMLDESLWTPGVHWFKKLAHGLALRLLGTAIDVRFANDSQWRFGGCYGGRELILNVNGRGLHWFDGQLAPMLDFIIHEFAHHYCGNHLDEHYHEACTKLGGELVQLCLEEPRLFRRNHLKVSEPA